ncbi:MAG: ribonuclease HII [Bryobacteraceae bacterium]
MRCTTLLEDRLRRQGFARVAGADEAGRGCLFGPVFAAAVILDPARPVPGLADSKALTPERRQSLAVLIRERALAFSIASASAEEIDRINIREASRLAIRRAVEGLRPPCDYLLVDALPIDLPVPQQALVKGDARVAAIAAASILAKTERDALMLELDARYPGYGIARHKGYPTAEHIAALRSLGPTPLHRRSFSPVQEALQGVL